MTATLSRDVMVGLLRRGDTGTEILDILNVIAPGDVEVTASDDSVDVTDTVDEDDSVDEDVTESV